MYFSSYTCNTGQFCVAATARNTSYTDKYPTSDAGLKSCAHNCSFTGASRRSHQIGLAGQVELFSFDEGDLQESAHAMFLLVTDRKRFLTSKSNHTLIGKIDRFDLSKQNGSLGPHLSVQGTNRLTVQSIKILALSSELTYCF